MTLGLPDLLICDDKHNFHFVELKYVKFNAVNLSPQQKIQNPRPGELL